MKIHIPLLALALVTQALAHGQAPAVTNEEALNLGHLVETHTTAGNPDVLSNLYDVDSFLLRISDHCRL